MGNWFSIPWFSSSKRENKEVNKMNQKILNEDAKQQAEEEKQYAKYMQTVQTLKEQEEELNKAKEINEQKEKELKDSSLEEQNKNASKALEELNKQLTNANEQNGSTPIVTTQPEPENGDKDVNEPENKDEPENENKDLPQLEDSNLKQITPSVHLTTSTPSTPSTSTLTYIQASQLICALYHNYQFGYIDSDPDKHWDNNVNSVISSCVNEKSFWLLCTIPQLLPLLWPIGKSDDSFHQYELDQLGNPNVSKYKSLVNSLIPNYVANTLPKLIANVCKSNCKAFIDFNDDKNNSIIKKCKTYISSIESISTDTEWHEKTLEFISETDDDEEMSWKCFAAKSGKGICESKIRLLPPTFPKVYPKYELYESLLMLTNTVLNHYGDLRKDDSTRVPAKEKNSASHTTGGQCFLINPIYTKHTFKKITGIMWNRETYADASTIILNSSDVTGYNDEDDIWMENTSVCDDLEIYGQNERGTGGFVKYVNPTQKYTRLFINDTQYVQVLFQMPRLSASVNETFRKTFLKTILNQLQTSAYQFNNVFSHVNKNFLTSIDYIYITPNGFEQVDHVSPIARYVFEVLVKNACKWYLTFPIENNMSLMKINSVILSTTSSISNSKKFLPQYIWANSENMNRELANMNAATSYYTGKNAYVGIKKYTPIDVTIE